MSDPAERPRTEPPHDPERDGRLERVILELLEQRAAGASICPSDAARHVGGDEWRPLMDPVRQAAARLAAQGDVVITQGGEVVDLDSVRGPIRIRLTGRTRRDASPT